MVLAGRPPLEQWFSGVKFRVGITGSKITEMCLQLHLVVNKDKTEI